MDLNATQAAIRAGYKEKAARSVGAENLTKPDIQKAIQSAIKERQDRTGITQDRVLKELGKVAFADANDSSESDLKYSNKLKALEMLGKHLGIFERPEKTTDEGVQIVDDL